MSIIKYLQIILDYEVSFTGWFAVMVFLSIGFTGTMMFFLIINRINTLMWH